jgi:hypothetical protein
MEIDEVSKIIGEDVSEWNLEPTDKERKSVTIDTLIQSTESNAVTIPTMVHFKQGKPMETMAMVDSGAGGNFIDHREVVRLGLQTHKLEKKVNTFNVDRTLNKKGTITRYITINLEIGDRIQPITFWVCGLGKLKMILGYSWLKEANPTIDWTKGTIGWDNETVNIENNTDQEIQENNVAIQQDI